MSKRLPNGYSIHVQRLTDGPGYVGLIHFYKEGMRWAVQVGRSYGATKKAARADAVKQVESGEFNVL